MADQTTPIHGTYDIVIIGGAMMGATVAWWLTRHPDFDGRLLVIEADPTYEHAATSHTNSCIRQQFGTEVNIKVSQFGAEFIQNFRAFMADEDAPDIPIQSYGYMYLAGDDHLAGVLRENQTIQSRLGAGTQILTPDQIAEAYPFYNLDGVILGSHNLLNEGYFDGGTIFDWVRRKSRQQGAEWIAARVAGLTRKGDRITGVTLEDGRTIGCGQLVNCAGTRGPGVAAMAGLSLPVEPRRRYTFIFDAEEPLDRDLPLTIDPSGVHVRTDGPTSYLAGCPPDDDPAVDPMDFEIDWSIWEDKVWPAIANRIPAFERIKLRTTWVGHYDFNTLDQNAILGPHPEVTNFHFCNGFSGHGLQQSPAVGRGMAEMLVTGGWRSLDLSDLSYARVAENRPFIEPAVI